MLARQFDFNTRYQLVNNQRDNNERIMPFNDIVRNMLTEYNKKQTIHSTNINIYLEEIAIREKFLLEYKEE